MHEKQQGGKTLKRIDKMHYEENSMWYQWVYDETIKWKIFFFIIIFFKKPRT